MKSYCIFIFASVLFFIGLTAWVGVNRYQDTVGYHTLVARQTTADVADEIARNIQDKQDQISLFATEHQDALLALVDNPGDLAQEKRIDMMLRRHFSDHFAFTIANSKGEPYIDDFDGKINEVCLKDIKYFSQNYHSLPRIHPNPGAYHYDIMSIIPGRKNEEHIFFVSFHAETLAPVLKHAQPPNHNLLLVMLGKKPLLEVSPEGPRYVIDRNDYHLEASEMRRLLSQSPVEGSRWTVIDLYSEGFFSSIRNALIKQSLLMVVPYLIFAVIMYFLFQREEKLRHQAETTKEEFLATISHELRTPLTAIQGSLRLIASGVTGPITAKTSDLLDIALKNSQRLILLVNDLLDMRSLETGKMDYSMQKLDLTSVVDAAIDENRDFARQFNCAFNFEPPVYPTFVKGDRNRLIQVMTNLLSNAAKYGDSDEVIDICISPVENGFRVSVHSKGSPIPPRYRHKLFKKFSRINFTNRKGVRGTGLGLSICKTIIENHHGIIGCQGDDNKGTIFYFELPAYPEQEEDEEPGGDVVRQ